MSNLIRHNLVDKNIRLDIREGVEIDIKYSGYLERQKSQIEQIKKQTKRVISTKINYSSIHTISQEGREALNAKRPKTFGEAIQIPGVSKADLTALLVWLKIQNQKKNKSILETNNPIRK